MPRDFPEPDWKTLSHLKPLALERLCERILKESSGIIAHAQDGGQHHTYLDLYRHIQDSDKVVSECFDKWSRSHALDLLISWMSEKLLTEEEFKAFSPETREIVNGWLERL